MPSAINKKACKSLFLRFAAAIYFWHAIPFLAKATMGTSQQAENSSTLEAHELVRMDDVRNFRTLISVIPPKLNDMSALNGKFSGKQFEEIINPMKTLKVFQSHA